MKKKGGKTRRNNPQRNGSFPEEMDGMWKWESRTPSPLPNPDAIVLCERKLKIKISLHLRELSGKEDPYRWSHLSPEGRGKF